MLRDRTDANIGSGNGGVGHQFITWAYVNPSHHAASLVLNELKWLFLFTPLPSNYMNIKAKVQRFSNWPSPNDYQ